MSNDAKSLLGAYAALHQAIVGLSLAQNNLKATRDLLGETAYSKTNQGRALLVRMGREEIAIAEVAAVERWVRGEVSTLLRLAGVPLDQVHRTTETAGNVVLQNAREARKGLGEWVQRLQETVPGSVFFFPQDAHSPSPGSYVVVGPTDELAPSAISIEHACMLFLANYRGDAKAREAAAKVVAPAPEQQ
jgi:hypothetical protein